jgi:hypothetical protein
MYGNVAAHAQSPPNFTLSEETAKCIRRLLTVELHRPFSFFTRRLCQRHVKRLTGRIIPAMPVQRSWKPLQALFDRYLAG